MTSGPMVACVDEFIVLGAGASYGARDSGDAQDTDRPAQGKALAAALLSYLDQGEFGISDKSQIDKTREFLRNAASDFEAAMDAVNHKYTANIDAASVEAVANPYVIQSLMDGFMLTHSSFDPRPDLYDDLLTVHEWPAKALAIISLNYDILLEEAALRVSGLPFSAAVEYVGLRGVAHGGRLRVFKPHGSVNWFASPTNRGSSRARSILAPKSPSLGRLERDGTLLSIDTDRDIVLEGTREAIRANFKRATDAFYFPIIATYSPGKPSLGNPSAIHSVRNEVMVALRDNPTAAMTVIGVGVGERELRRDPFLHALMVENHEGRCVTHVNPYCDDARSLEKAGNLKFNLREETLKEYLAACGKNVSTVPNRSSR